jgi:hypothetical protein
VEGQRDRKTEAFNRLQVFVDQYTPIRTSVQPSIKSAASTGYATLKHLSRVNSVQFKLPNTLARRNSKSSILSHHDSAIHLESVPSISSTDDVNDVENAHQLSPCDSVESFAASFDSSTLRGTGKSANVKRRGSVLSGAFSKLWHNTSTQQNEQIDASKEMVEATALSILKLLCAHIESNGLDVDGIYRIAAPKQRVENLLKIIQSTVWRLTIAKS